MDMREMIMSMPDQIKDQYRNLKDIEFDKTKFSGIKSIVIAGMGGSAISGDLCRLILNDTIDIPIHIVRDYNLPAWCDSSTLFILSSYSGNTEETLSIYNQSKEISDMIISVTTGGELELKSRSDGVDIVSIPSGFQPRAAIGLSLISLFIILRKLNKIDEAILDSLLYAADEIKAFHSNYCSKDGFAQEVAEKVRSCVLYIYGVESSTDVIASRFRAQLAENSKVLASHHSLPELNHNEIEGWNNSQFKDLDKKIIWIKDPSDHIQIKSRIDITSNLLSDLDVESIHIEAEGDNKISRVLKLIYLTDWISYIVAKLNDVDPIPVSRIEDLKRQMPKINL